MTTAEIAALFRSTPTLAEDHPGLAAIMGRAAARAAEGAPCHLENAVIDTHNAAHRALSDCRYALQRQARLGAPVLASLAEASPAARKHGLGWRPADDLSCMNSDDPARLRALAQAAVGAHRAAVDIFEALGDRIQATEKERHAAHEAREELDARPTGRLFDDEPREYRAIAGRIAREHLAEVPAKRAAGALRTLAAEAAARVKPDPRRCVEALLRLALATLLEGPVKAWEEGNAALGKAWWAQEYRWRAGEIMAPALKAALAKRRRYHR